MERRGTRTEKMSEEEQKRNKKGRRTSWRMRKRKCRQR